MPVRPSNLDPRAKRHYAAFHDIVAKTGGIGSKLLLIPTRRIKLINLHVESIVAFVGADAVLRIGNFSDAAAFLTATLTTTGVFDAAAPVRLTFPFALNTIAPALQAIYAIQSSVAANNGQYVFSLEYELMDD